MYKRQTGESAQKPAGGTTGSSEESAADEGIESEESDIELDTTGVIERESSVKTFCISRTLHLQCNCLF